ncbi:MAG: hypothetical protein KJ056_12295 [Acidimicrobiia bacterium]|nr:hypothetical protein [Acidimicrobiia bacterium]
MSTFGYDSAHRLVSWLDPAQQGAGSPQPLTDVYYPDGRVKSQTDFSGEVTTFWYSGDVTLVGLPDGTANGYSYPGGVMTAEYRAIFTASQAVTLFEHDPETLGVTKVTDPTGRVSTATYDDRGYRASATDPAGATTTWSYGSRGELLTMREPGGTETTWTYDARLNPTGITRHRPGAPAAETETTTFTYGNAAHPGDVTTMVDAAVKVWSYTYDAAGNRTDTVDPAGGHHVVAYDGIGRPVVTVTPRGFGLPGWEWARYATGYGYNAFGDVITEARYGIAAVTKRTFDANRRLVEVVDPDGVTVTNTYDPAGRVVSTRRGDETTAVTTIYAYDVMGRVKSRTDGAGRMTSYSYDLLGNRTGRTDPAGRTETAVYDRAGRPTSGTDPSNRSTTLSYDTAGRLTKIDYQTSTTADVTFTYTVDGQRKTMADGTGTTTWTYDTLGRTTNVTDGAGRSVGYGYDPAGRVTSLSYPGGQNVTRGYDDLGRLVSTVDPQAGTIGYTWDADGNLTGITTPNGVTTSRSYDVAGRLIGIETERGSARLAAFTYTRSGAGRMASQTPDPAGTSIVDGYGLPEAYGYDRAGRAQSVNGAGWYGYSAGDDLTHRFLANSTYDGAGQLTGMCIAWGACATYTNSPLGERLSATAGTNTTTYGYDQASRLTAYTAPGVSATYSYDGDGLRATATSTAAGNRNFAWDRVSGSVPLLFTDGTTRYGYGPGDLPVAEITGTTVRYLHTDQAASVRTVTNTSGTVAATATWDAYGARLAASGTPSRLGWQGQYTDSDTGLVYLRARYYDPATATFLTPDPLQDRTRTPYTYAANDPWNHADPSGLTIVGLLARELIIGSTAELSFQMLGNVLGGCSPFHDINWTNVAFWGIVNAATAGTIEAANTARASRATTAATEMAGVAEDAVTAGRTGSASWGRTIDDFQHNGDRWRRVSAHAEGATGRTYRGGTSIEVVFESGGDRLIRHRIYGPNGELLHETFRPYAKFGAS